MTGGPGPGDLKLAGAGMRLLLTPVTRGTERGMQVEIDAPGQGHAAVVLEPHEATQVRDHLTAWLATTLPADADADAAIEERPPTTTPPAGPS